MNKTIEALRQGTKTVQQLLAESPRESGGGAASVWHTFALDCAERVLTHERETGREPHAVLWDAIKAKRIWLEAHDANTPKHNATQEHLQVLQQHRHTALQAAGNFGKTGLTFVQRVWRQITDPAILQQIRTSSRLIAVGKRAATMTYSFAAISAVTAMSPSPILSAGQTAAAAIHYAIFTDEVKNSPFTLGQPGLSLGPPGPTAANAFDNANPQQPLRPLAQEQAWQCEQLLQLLLTHQSAIKRLLPLLQNRRQHLTQEAQRWHNNLEDALFHS